MSRLVRFAFFGIACSLVACGSSNDESKTRSQAINGDKCDPSQTNCDPTVRQPPNPPAPQCAIADLNVSMCLDRATLRQLASLACESQGTALSSLEFQGGNCGPVPPVPSPTQPPQTEPGTGNDPDQKDGSDGQKPGTGGLEPKEEGRATGVKFSCCAKPPPPPPSPCFEIPIATTNGTDDAQRICAEKGGVLSSDSDKPEPVDQNGLLYVRCCPTQPPVPPPTERCTVLEPQDATVCSTKDAALQSAIATCTARNLTYRDFSVSACDSASQNADLGVTLKSVTCCDGIAYPTQPDDGQKP